MGMTFEQKGAYLEMLVFQFNNGRFSEAQAKQVLSICFASVWRVVGKKFNTDGKVYWNDRLELEVVRRKSFTESRRKNAKGGKDISSTSGAYAQHMETKDEDINGYKREVIEIGDKSKEFVIIYPKQINTPITKLFGKEGMQEFYQGHRSVIARPEFIEKYLRDRNGKHLNDFQHLFSDYNLFVKSLFK